MTRPVPMPVSCRLQKINSEAGLPPLEECDMASRLKLLEISNGGILLTVSHAKEFNAPTIGKLGKSEQNHRFSSFLPTFHSTQNCGHISGQRPHRNEHISQRKRPFAPVVVQVETEPKSSDDAVNW